jgi:hypothetical protein
LPPNLAGHAKQARNARIRVHKTVSNLKYGYARSYFHFVFFDTIHIYENSFELDNTLLASLLIHEAVHVNQWVPRERPAYQADSDFLRALGIKGTLSEVKQQFPGEANGGYLHVSAKQYQRYQVKDPAVY